MNKDYVLLDEALVTLKEVRTWVSAEYYKTRIMPVVTKLKERLATLEASKFIDDRHKRYYETVDYKSKADPVEIQKKIDKINRYEPDTVPNKLVEITTNFGLFAESVKSEFCKNHPDAPHRYLKDLSASMGRYVCQCEFWQPK